MADGGRAEIDDRSTPVAGPLSVTPLYTSTGNDVVWWNAVMGSWEAQPSGGGGGGSGNVTAGTLTNNALVVGTGPTAIGSLASLGSSTTVLHGNASGAPAFSAVNLGTDVSGVLAAAQSPAHTGDVTSAAGSLALTIAPGVVSYAKMQAMTANRLLGSGLSGTAVAEITLGTGLSFTGTTLNAAAGANYGVDVTAFGGPPRRPANRRDDPLARRRARPA
jgi:hypothetical protein